MNNLFLASPTKLPLRSIQTIAKSPILVVAPHPDDETLGCGGAIALSRQLGCEVQILVISDGTQSHPNSQQYPPPVLQALREDETIAGVSILGVPAEFVTFLQLQDGAVPAISTPEGRSARIRCSLYLESVIPAVIFLPWRYDPHPDHRAAWQLIRAALADLPFQPRLIEYPIWDWDPQQSGQLPIQDRFAAWRLDISAVLPQKRQAIAAYRSQTTALIQDDPTGFRLSTDMLKNFTRSWEIYLEVDRQTLKTDRD
ncbi:MAG: PIG-L family deacetylase [Scytolyngbya sp. HA4215-MV1]|jgi:LmbE family N-acetylglucosaminyl deacetylase|nr:PIG-L family deacetylase [Scytolyngbya sp. HA4215-MV1]